MTDGGPAQSRSKEAVERWLDDAGYPLKYFAAHVFRHAGFSVAQGTHVGTRSDGSREIDLIAGLSEVCEGAKIRLTNVVECRSGKRAPWVVMTSRDRLGGPMDPDKQLACDPWGSLLMWHASTVKHVAGTVMLDERKLTRIGFSGAVAAPRFEPGPVESDDPFYDALRKVCTAARALTLSSMSPDAKIGTPLPVAATRIARPVVVTEAELFECHLDEDGMKIVVEEVDVSRVRWDGFDGARFSLTVDVVRRDHLSVFAADRRRDFGQILPSLSIAHFISGPGHDFERLKERANAHPFPRWPLLIEEMFGKRPPRSQTRPTSGSKRSP